MKAILGDREVKYPEFSIREGQEEISDLVEIEVVDTRFAPVIHDRLSKMLRLVHRRAGCSRG